TGRAHPTTRREINTGATDRSRPSRLTSALSPPPNRRLHPTYQPESAAAMSSGGIARGRLAEERKAWRKNHPHVRPPPSLLSISLPASPHLTRCFDRGRGCRVVWSVFLICLVLVLAGLRRQAGDAGRRHGQPHGLALHHPRQARD
uniref:Uncharacterized protein n=1 Tax=Aegilops tauschii subsp. strangulata TaxID=200361 RepID=A0A453J607_AEGTS